MIEMLVEFAGEVLGDGIFESPLVMCFAIVLFWGWLIWRVVR